MDHPQPPNGNGYGPPPGYNQTPQSFAAYGPGYAPRPPTKKGMGAGTILLLVLGGLLGTCTMCGAIGAASKSTKSRAASAAASTDPAALSAKRATDEKAAAEAKDAKDAKEKEAVASFPQRSVAIAASLKKCASAVDGAKWAAANTELETAEQTLRDLRGTSVAETKPFKDLDVKAGTLRTRIAPQLAKIEAAERAAASEKELRANSTAVTSYELFNAYQANEVAADNAYARRKLLVTGTVASVDKGPFGGLILRLATPNEFMSTMCRMESGEESNLAQLSKGDRVRVLCIGQGMTIGSPSLGDCSFR